MIFPNTLISELQRNSANPPSGIQYQKSPLNIFTAKKRPRSMPIYAIAQSNPSNPSKTIVKHLINSIPAPKNTIVTKTNDLCLGFEGT
mmetsp:Transcript_23105/g.47921  ORF Transcript_23105/g.47921 Transcript_23105/m.47921 type:complete len:88 (+) Transcript_23105:88-351(+)